MSTTEPKMEFKTQFCHDNANISQPQVAHHEYQASLKVSSNGLEAKYLILKNLKHEHMIHYRHNSTLYSSS